MNIILPATLTQDLEPGANWSLVERLQRMSEEEFCVFCRDNQEVLFERETDGTITGKNSFQDSISQKFRCILSHLHLWNEPDKRGWLFEESTFRLPNGITRSPEVAWVSSENWNGLRDETQCNFITPLRPDFIVELVPSSYSLSALAQRANAYIFNGCRLAWLIDPKNETARIFRADGSVSVVKSFEETMSGEDVLPGFSFALSLLR